MIIRRLLAVCALLFASLGLVASPSAHAADCEGPATGVRGKKPLCDLNPGDARKFTLTTAEAAPGGTVNFTASGFVRDEGGGQTLTFKFNDIDIIGSGVEADADGNASGSITLPDAAVFKKYQSEYGSDRWWIRVLVGSGRSDGAPDLPAASLHAEFTVTGLDGGSQTTPSSTSTPTTSTTPSSTTPSSGTLPKTGIEDHGVLLASGLAAAALLALVVERRFRRRRTADSV